MCWAGPAVACQEAAGGTDSHEAIVPHDKCSQKNYMAWIASWILATAAAVAKGIIFKAKSTCSILCAYRFSLHRFGLVSLARIC